MAQSCRPKDQFFDLDRDSSKLSTILETVYTAVELKLGKKVKENTEDTFTEDFYNELIAYLQSENTPFRVGYSSDLTRASRKTFVESFMNLKNLISELISTSKFKRINTSEFRQILDDRLQKSVGAGRLKIQKEDNTGEFIIDVEGAVENERPVNDTRLREFLDDIYGNQFGSVKMLKNTFSREIFAYSLFDFDAGTLITTSTQLNKSLAKYKNVLLKRIVDFLSEKYPNNSYPSEIFTSNGVHRGYFAVLAAMQKYLNNLGDREGFIGDEYGKKVLGQESKALDAIHAYSILKYFDSFIYDTMGRVIKVTSYENQEVPIPLEKYSFSKDTAHHRKSWSDSEARTAAQNTSRFAKFVISAIPLKINGFDSGKNLDINLLNSTMTKLFRNVSRLHRKIGENREVRTLIDHLDAFHNNPKVYTIKILELISNSENLQNILSSNIKFTDTDLGVVKSLYDYVFAFDSENAFKSWENQTIKSIRALEFNTLKSSTNLGHYSIVNDIVNVINDSMNASYWQTTYGYDGGMESNIREKGVRRRDSENFKDTVTSNTAAYSQEQRLDLMKSCQVLFDTDTNTQLAHVTIPINYKGGKTELHFDVVTGHTIGILAQSDVKYQGSDLDIAQLMPKILALFDRNSPIDFLNAQHRNDILYSENKDDYVLMREILKFIDERLYTKFLSEDGLQKLGYFKKISLDSGKEDWFKDLLVYSVKTQVISDLYYDFRNAIAEPSQKKYKTWNDFIPWLRENYLGFKSLTSDQYSTYFKINNGQYKLVPIPSSTAWVDDMVEGKKIFYGEDIASTSKNQSNNNDANYLTSFLGGQIFNICYNAEQAANKRDQEIAEMISRVAAEVEASIENDPEYIRLTNTFQYDAAEAYKQEVISKAIAQNANIPRTTASALFFTGNRRAITECVINSDVKNREGTVKQLRDLKSSELLYNAIIHNFWGAYQSTGEYCIQPTTYSDKVKIINYLINASYKVTGRNGKKKTLHELEKDELIELYRTTVGQASKLALDNLKYFYRQIFGRDMTLDEINAELKKHDEEWIKEEASKHNLEAKLDFHYRIKRINGKKVLALNELIPRQAQYVDREVLKQKFVKEEVNFINNLVASGIFFYIDYHDTSLFNENYKELKTNVARLQASSSPVANIILNYFNNNEVAIEKYASDWIQNGKLILAKDQNGKPVLSHQVTNISEMNPLLEKYFYMDTVLANNLRMQLTGFETNHPDKSKAIELTDQLAKELGIKNDLLNADSIKKLQKSKVWVVSQNIYPYEYNGILITSDISQIGKEEVIDLRGQDMSLNDIKALYEDFDLYQLSQSTSPQIRQLANNLITVVENFAQSTQLKRNVIIPATMHYTNNDLLEGVSKKVKVAVINDIKSKVFNFSGMSDEIDAMDGAAWVVSFQSILENKSLGSQEVGADKKPIWGDYDQETGTATLLKFATFEINNERMRKFRKPSDSKGSAIDLYDVFRKMTDLQWSTVVNGQRVWETEVPVDLSKNSHIADRQTQKRSGETVDIINDILEGRHLYYKGYDEDGQSAYREIMELGGDVENGYYTVEQVVDEAGDPIEDSEIVYHFFTEDGIHYTRKEGEGKLSENDHTINSLFELWLVMGGLDSQSLDADGLLQYSEISHHAVVGFMNQVSVKREKADRFDLSQNAYIQPLKDMMIGYLANNSAVKNGAANRNSSERWYDEKKLAYMTLSTNGLGIQMDADHDVEELATMTEFSQVISALESGGNLHKFSKQVYNDLGKVALIASGIEIDVITKFLTGYEGNYDEVRSQLYDIVTKTLINQIKSRDDQASLTDEILKAIGRTFNRNMDHVKDTLKIPNSDNGIYGQILPAIVSLINQKSIKRKYPGSGCVMVPGFNMMTYFRVDGQRYDFNDLVENAIEYYQENGIPLPQGLSTRDFERAIVDRYLADMQELEAWESSVSSFIPTDIVEAESSTGQRYTFNLDGLNEYYSFKDIHKAQAILAEDPLLEKNKEKDGTDNKNAQLVKRVAEDLKLSYAEILALKRYRHNIRRARNLAPVRITFEREDGIGSLMNIFDLAPFRKAHLSKGGELDRKEVQQAFKNLSNGFYVDEAGQKIRIKNLRNLPAEMVISNMYSKKFGIEGKSIAQIRKEGVEAFRLQYTTPLQSDNYEISFTRANGNDLYISFKSPKNTRDNNIYVPYKKSELLYEKNRHGSTDVWLTKDNRKLFKVGRYVPTTDYMYENGKYYKWVEKEGKRKKELANGQEANNLKIQDSVVYEYIEFVSPYKVNERVGIQGDSESFDSITEYDKYYINAANIRRSFKDKKATEQEVNDFITDILDDIYATQQFVGMKINPTIDTGTALTIVQAVSNMNNFDVDFKKTVIKKIEKDLRNWIGTIEGNALKSDKKFETKVFKDYYNQYYDKLAPERYHSWEQSLFFTAARIPAQTLQSFMQMEAVAYSGNTENKVYVSHWQAWLQGSD